MTADVVELFPRRYDVTLGRDGVIAVHEDGLPACEVVTMDQDTALQLAYALMALTSTQGPAHAVVSRSGRVNKF